MLTYSYLKKCFVTTNSSKRWRYRIWCKSTLRGREYRNKGLPTLATFNKYTNNTVFVWREKSKFIVAFCLALGDMCTVYFHEDILLKGGVYTSVNVFMPPPAGRKDNCKLDLHFLVKLSEFISMANMWLFKTSKAKRKINEENQLLIIYF